MQMGAVADWITAELKVQFCLGGVDRFAIVCLHPCLGQGRQPLGYPFHFKRSYRDSPAWARRSSSCIFSWLIPSCWSVSVKRRRNA